VKDDGTPYATEKAARASSAREVVEDEVMVASSSGDPPQSAEQQPAPTESEEKPKCMSCGVEMKGTAVKCFTCPAKLHQACMVKVGTSLHCSPHCFGL
jgi:tRNA(Ile2) C34 agmatinyltransferase TiaS